MRLVIGLSKNNSVYRYNQEKELLMKIFNVVFVLLHDEDMIAKCHMLHMGLNIVSDWILIKKREGGIKH